MYSTAPHMSSGTACGLLMLCKRNRQCGLASGDEWKLYDNEMIQQLENAATASDRISGVSTSCVAVADDVAPSVTADDPREALH